MALKMTPWLFYHNQRSNHPFFKISYQFGSYCVDNGRNSTYLTLDKSHYDLETKDMVTKMLSTFCTLPTMYLDYFDKNPSLCSRDMVEYNECKVSKLINIDSFCKELF